MFVFMLNNKEIIMYFYIMRKGIRCHYRIVDLIFGSESVIKFFCYFPY